MGIAGALVCTLTVKHLVTIPGTMQLQWVFYRAAEKSNIETHFLPHKELLLSQNNLICMRLNRDHRDNILRLYDNKTLVMWYLGD
jgi:hypothetical protein